MATAPKAQVGALGSHAIEFTGWQNEEPLHAFPVRGLPHPAPGILLVRFTDKTQAVPTMLVGTSAHQTVRYKLHWLHDDLDGWPWQAGYLLEAP